MIKRLPSLFLLATLCTPLLLAGCSVEESGERSLAAFDPNLCPDEGKVGICHATSSTTNPYVFIRVSTKACESAHAGHSGDVLTEDSTCQCAGKKDDTECDTNADGKADGLCKEGNCVAASACAAAGKSDFTDTFDRDPGSLGSAYLSVGPLPSATIISKMACADDHGGAVVQVNTPKEYVEVAYDFMATGVYDLETQAIAADLCKGLVLVAGLNGGNRENNVIAPKLEIKLIDLTGMGAGATIESQKAGNPNIVKGETYRVVAQFYATGKVTVGISGNGVSDSLTGMAAEPITIHQAGAIAGRNECVRDEMGGCKEVLGKGELGCVDNLSINVN